MEAVMVEMVANEPRERLAGFVAEMVSGLPHVRQRENALVYVRGLIEQGGRIEAFLLSLREGADYDSANYRWFAQRYACFLYVDRIVVASSMQAHGAGRRLYRDAYALASRHAVQSCRCASNWRRSAELSDPST